MAIVRKIFSVFAFLERSGPRMSGEGVSIDTRDVLPLLKALNGVERELRLNANRRLRAAAGECARALIVDLRAAAAASATPQAVLVARAAAVSSDRVPAVKLGGSRRVGHRRTPAGALLWGSERGGPRFGAPAGGNYWIDPTVKRFQASRAVDIYRAAVVGVLADAGVL
jgi:hypothetical protein